MRRITNIQEGLNMGAGNGGHQEDGLGDDAMICPSPFL